MRRFPHRLWMRFTAGKFFQRQRNLPVVIRTQWLLSGSSWMLLTARFKQLAGAGVPLGEQEALLDATRQNLLDWHSALGRQYTRLLRDLLIHICSIAAILLLIVIVAAAWKHATFRYVQDVRRRRQLLLIRRIFVAVLVVFVIIGSVVNEFGSLATFAGPDYRRHRGVAADGDSVRRGVFLFHRPIRRALAIA